jgi:predicted enzyme related to lactoylglutathione lyase
MTSARFAFALEYVDDVQPMKRFCTEVLGLQVEREAPTFVQFKDAAFAIASDESMTDSRDPELWWVVDNAEAALSEISARAEVSMPLRQMPFGTCFGVKDPSGQRHYLLEFARTRPSQSVA